VAVILSQWRTMAEMLDGLGIALCIFDEQDRALHWNRRFLALFPEHDGHLHVGEPYRENLRRFYEHRLAAEERPQMQRLIDEGVARHRGQQRPFEFEHRGRRLRVSSLPVPGLGRVRVWRELQGGDVAAPAGTLLDGTEVFDHLADGVMVAAADGTIQWVNEPFVRLYHLATRERARGQTLQALYRQAWQAVPAVLADEALRHEQGLAVLADQLRFAGAPFEVPLPAGRWVRVVEQRSAAGQRYLVHVDITQQKRQQELLAAAEARARDSERALAEKSALLEATLERMEQGVIMVDAQRIVQVCNRRAIELLGLPAAMMRARPSVEAVLAWQREHEDFEQAPPSVQDLVRTGGILDRPHTYDRQRPDGRIIEIHSVPVAGGGVLRTYTDITERRHAEDRIRHLARHDGLTSLVNREVFLEHLAGAMQALERRGRRADDSKAGEGLAVHYIDLDGFKPVNDRHGHGVGDKVLAAVAERLRAVARERDIAARLGGDEFAVLQGHVLRQDVAVALAHRLLDALRAPLVIEGHAIDIGASLGVAWTRQSLDPEHLLREADAAMYAAKAAGRNRVRVVQAGHSA
jgi:diguanylate cyclase (GGDEF)-like protein